MIYKPGDKVFWVEGDGEPVYEGLLIAIDPQSRLAAIDTGTPTRTCWKFVPVCDLFDTAAEAEASRAPEPWSAAKCIECIAVWMDKHKWNGKISGNTFQDEWHVRFENYTPNGRSVKGVGRTWCEAVQQALTIWDKEDRS